MAFEYKFPWLVKDLVCSGELKGIVTYVDSKFEFGVEAQFINEHGKDEIVYFNKHGRAKIMDTNDRLKKREAR